MLGGGAVGGYDAGHQQRQLLHVSVNSSSTLANSMQRHPTPARKAVPACVAVFTQSTSRWYMRMVTAQLWQLGCLFVQLLCVVCEEVKQAISRSS
jgi:hypothetical protein